MLIDIILDRFNSEETYSSKALSDYCSGWEDELYLAVHHALCAGDEAQVKQALCSYVTTVGYTPSICDYINSVDWVGVEPAPVSESGCIRGWLATDEDGDCYLYFGDKPESFYTMFLSDGGADNYIALPAGAFEGLRPAPMAEPVEVAVDIRLFR